MPRAKVGTKTAAAKKPRKVKGHALAEKFARGEVLKDLFKQEWSLGDVIGQGGFGLIYLAAEKGSSKTGVNAEYVVKIEPISNGPLFCELHFYQRVGKADVIDAFARSKKLRYLGVPKYIASGQHVYQGNEYRFMVMQRYSTDLQLIFEGAGKRFSKQTVYAIALRLIDCLEYLHENNYVHADVKASNCLLGHQAGKTDVDKVWLVDFGLASKYAPNGVHREYKEEPKKAHDGTIEFTSRDAHNGVQPSRRADMEILGYCLLQWLCGKLPWEDKLTDPNYVADSKRKYMNDIPSLMKKCFPQGNAPAEISNYLTLVKKLGYEEKPNYKVISDGFVKGLSNLGVKDTWKLALPVAGAGVSTIVSPKKTAKKRVLESDEDVTAKKAKARPATPKAKSTTPKPSTSKPATPRAGTSKTPNGNISRSTTPKARTTPASAAKRAKSPIKPKLTPPAQKKPKSKAVVKSPKSKAVVKSPSAASVKAAKAGLAAISPRAQEPKAVKRAKSPAANSPQPKKRKVVRRKNVQMSEIAIQTSPGLKKNK